VQAVGIPALVQALLAPGNALAEEIKAKRKAKGAAPVVRPEEQFKR
jgi:hypothetical protein